MRKLIIISLPILILSSCDDSRWANWKESNESKQIIFNTCLDKSLPTTSIKPKNQINIAEDIQIDESGISGVIEACRTAAYTLHDMVCVRNCDGLEIKRY